MFRSNLSDQKLEEMIANHRKLADWIHTGETYKQLNLEVASALQELLDRRHAEK
jgi:hypothetical protein